MKHFKGLLLVLVLLALSLPALAESSQDPYVFRLYYNPQGGKHRHLDQNCPTASAMFLPLQVLPEDQWESLAPCPHCMGDMPLIASAGGKEGDMLPSLLFEVYQTRYIMPEWEDYTTYLIKITDKADPTRVFPNLLFPSQERDGLAALLQVQDLNFDGYADIKALCLQGAANQSCTFFLYNPLDGQFHHEPVFQELSNYSLYPDQKLILNNIHDSAATGIDEIYTITGDGRPLLYRRLSILHDEGTNWEKLRVTLTQFDPDGAETLLMDLVQEPDSDASAYLARWKAWHYRLYEGIDSSLVKDLLGEE